MDVVRQPTQAVHEPYDAMSTSEIRRLARAFEHSAAGIALQTPDGVWREVNAAFCDLVGYTRAELIGKSSTEITHAEDVARSLHQLERLNKQEISSFRFEKRYVHSTGRDVWVRLDVSMVLDDETRPELIITQANDITASRQIREQLADNEARLRSIIRSMAEGVMAVDLEGRFSLVNQPAADILQLDPRTLQAMSLSGFRGKCMRDDGTPFPPDKFPVLVTLKTGRPQREIVMELTRDDGEPIWIEMSTEPVYADNTREILGVVATFSDITVRIRTEQALRGSEERLSLAVEGAKLGMWDWNMESRALSLNKIATRLLGYNEDDIDPSIHSVRALAHPDDAGMLVDEMNAHLAGTKPYFEVDIRMRRKSGAYVWTNLRGRITDRDRDDRPRRVTGVLIDISQRKDLEAQLKRLATTDELTGLFNRRHGTEALRMEISRAGRSEKPFSLILLDIDHFKNVNDRFGHDVGDRVLADVAELLRKRIRKTDMAARWGGEEFAIILSATDRSGGYSIASELLAHMSEIKTPDGEGISASFGVVDYRGDESASELVKRADRLMYKAKTAGRARVEVESDD